MKLLRNLVLLAALAPLQLLAQSADGADFKMPSASEVGRAIATLCSTEAQGATLGFAARESGRPLEYVLAQLPDPGDAALNSILRGMKRTIQDVYEHPSIGYNTMFFYRSKACFRERTELKAMPSVAFSAAGLLSCENEHGREKSSELLACVGRVVSAL